MVMSTELGGITVWMRVRGTNASNPVPGEAAQRFYDQRTAPNKQLVWFENSAHTT
jgi:esterase/lipase